MARTDEIVVTWRAPNGNGQRFDVGGRFAVHHAEQA